MHLTRSLATASLATCLTAGLTTTASAAPILIENHSFEEPGVGSGNAGGDGADGIDGWTKNGYISYILVIDENHSAYPDAPDKDQ